MSFNTTGLKSITTQRPCSDFMDMLQRLISRRRIIIIIIINNMHWR